MNRFWLIFLIVGISYGNDTLKKNTTVKPEHSPRKAAVLSAIIPGLGQAYNRSWWKIPVVYASLGAFTYFAIDNHKQYTFVRNNLIAEADQNPNTVNVTGLPAAQLSEIKRQYKNRRDLCIAGAIAVYVLQIVEANVDAHLKTFDVSDNLSIRFAPAFTEEGMVYAACITFKFANK